MKRLLLMTLTIVLVAGCRATLPEDLRNPATADSGVVGLHIELGNVLGFTNVIDGALFAKLLNGKNRKGGIEIFKSNYRDGSLTYLLNAEPGTYEVVGTYHYKEGVRPWNILVFFNEELVSQLRFSVEAGRLTYIGDVRAELEDRKQVLPSGDATQLFYLPEVYKVAPEGQRFDGSAIPGNVETSEGSRNRFIEESRALFEATGWMKYFE